MPRYDFTDQEVIVLKQMIDLAVRSSGLQGAEAALALTRKLNNPQGEPALKDDKKESGTTTN